MPSKDLGEDISFFLYLAPIVAAIVYGVYEWVTIARSSSSMPQLAYLLVTKSPYLFLLSVIVVCLGVIVELRSSPSAERAGIVIANASRMQILGVVVLIISFCAGVSSSGYSDLAGAFDLFLAGRYALIFAFFMLAVSLFLAPRQIVSTTKVGAAAEIVGLLLMVASPIVLYGGLKIHLPFSASAIISLVVFAVGLTVFANRSRFLGRPRSEKPATAQAPQQSS